MSAEELGPPRVLLVDDKPENLLALQAILQDAGYQLLTAHSGEEALRIALREPLSVVLLDVVMPGMDGFEVARELKHLKQARDIPLLFLTAVATDIGHIYRAYEAGAVDYLVKPLDPKVVRTKVAVFVELVRQREQIRAQAAALREADRREYEVKLAEVRLASDRRYRKLVEGIDHAIGWTTDADLKFTFVSRRGPSMLGYPLQEFLRPGFWESHLFEEEKEEVLALFRAALEHGTEQACNHRLVAADGRVLWFHTGISGEPARDGEPAELHGISVDITDIKRAEQEAKRATHVREELLAVVAHDLRNPLSAIRMSAALLQRVAAKVKEEHVERTVRTILRSSDRMDRLISDLLDVALIQAERLTVEKQEVDVEDLVRECLEMLRPVADEKGIRLSSACPPGLRVSGDGARLLQVLSNLLGNAVKFTPEGGTVEVRAEPAGQMAVFTVSDSGPGMTDEEVAHVWSRFWHTKKQTGGGTGLGLFIAKGLVEAHGGRIWAEPGPQGGAAFRFTVPVAGLWCDRGDGQYGETLPHA